MTARSLLPLAAAALCAGLCGCGESVFSSADAASVTPSRELAEAKANAVAVSPIPGTEDASPYTQISFLGPAGTKVSNVSVVGSHSGNHSGKLRRYSTGTGESFLLNKPLTPGEQVAVHALVGFGPTHPAAPSKPVTSVFAVAHQASVSQSEFAKEPGDSKAVQHYLSAPSLTPSAVTITTPAQSGAATGDLFMAPYQGLGTPGEMIAEQNGNLVWFRPLPKDMSSTNFRVQEYEGKPVLTWWQGRILQVGFGQGEDVIYDSSYKPIATIKGGNGYKADLHELRLSTQGTAWIDEFDPIHMNTSAEHGTRNGILTDSVVQEIDVKTGLVMWEWHALGHIPLGDSTMAAQRSSYPWDVFHVNSIDPGTSGDLLLSSRNTCALYDVNLKTGAFNWQLGGPHSTFKLGPGARTWFQHDAEFQEGGLISAFDNGASPVKEKQSRGVLLKVDYAHKAVTLVKAFTNPAKTLSAVAQGNTLALPGGDWLMGYGNLPNFTEYSSSGSVLLDGTLGRGVQDFRTYLSPWSGHPTEPPAIAATHSGSSVTVYSSWNGATEVASWQILTGESPSSLTIATTVPKSGFETSATLSAPSTYVETRALSSSGAVLASSAPLHVQ
ncbi:MAG TPA: arylsulfotransferase family protein [Solirubrobacteraceae bacterium]|nr:arylsulfotransferase family protein [Solirubrobacteraceae bacterium]